MTAGVYNPYLTSAGGGGGGSGTVTSVSFTGGLISVANPTTTPSFTVAGTSGGIPYFSNTSTWASSALLAANALMIGGGAGAAPSTTTTATGILTFLGAPSSANLRAAVTDETGTGLLVFATDPTFTLTDITTNNASTSQHGWLPKLGGGTTNFLRADGTWAAPGGSGTVTVVSSGSLVSTAIVTGGGTTTLQTPSATSTLDSSGNMSLAGSLTVGNAATTAGAVALTQGTTQSTGTTNVTIQAPTSVTSYIITVPGTVGATGLMQWTVSGSVATLSSVTQLPSNITVDGTNLVGYRGAPQNSQSAAYTTVLADAGKCIFHPASDANARTFTIDSNANVPQPIGTIHEFINMSANNVTIAITSDTMTLLPAGTTGSRTLAQYGRASAEKISSTAWIISGNSGLT